MTSKTSADTIVIGGGSAGCVIAGRLAAENKEVLLIEAGPDYGAFGATVRRTEDWSRTDKSAMSQQNWSTPACLPPPMTGITAAAGGSFNGRKS